LNKVEIGLYLTMVSLDVAFYPGFNEGLAFRIFTWFEVHV